MVKLSLSWSQIECLKIPRLHSRESYLVICIPNSHENLKTAKLGHYIIYHNLVLSNFFGPSVPFFPYLVYSAIFIPMYIYICSCHYLAILDPRNQLFFFLQNGRRNGNVLKNIFTKWPPGAILDGRKSLLIAFLAISYATF